ncbi:hypothetical protein GGP41_006267 [Bipolaris sorokiniana]|uniref:Uncharacterized protein n=2 Tax=Cochliobolus sativus TaxID=45130 RepID=A0A8H5ZIF8_COCSA|nr:hypothetical protein GGP41_006267 [Bipolaris sorokiniana]
MVKRSCASLRISKPGTSLIVDNSSSKSSECTVLAIQRLIHIITLLVPRHHTFQLFHKLHITASHHPHVYTPSHGSTPGSISLHPITTVTMCWVTLTPSRGKKKGYQPTSDSSCVEDIVRIHRNPASPRLTNVRIKAPSVDVEVDEKLTQAHVYPHLQHHHRHPHLHPLHMHPIHGEHHLGVSLGLGHQHYRGSLDMSEAWDPKLRGQGRKRSIPSPCPPPPKPEPAPAHPPPPSCSSSSSPPPSTAPADTSPLIPPSIPRDPIYHTQIIQPTSPRARARGPGPSTVRETTRIALRTSTATSNQPQQRRPRNNLRRVAGYQVLGRQVPWDWDCVSSTASNSSNAGGGTKGKWVRRKSGGAGLVYPPFGDAEKWM